MASAHVSAFKTPMRNAKLFKSRAFNDENNAYVYPQTTKKSGKKAITERVSLASKTIDRNWSARHGQKKLIGLRPLSEITNKTPHPKKNGEKTLSASLKLLEHSDYESEVTPRRLSSTRKTTRLPGFAHKNLKTPISGNPWDVSDGSIDVASPDIEPIQLEDDDDVEYYPPTSLEPDHGLDLDFPDYGLARQLFIYSVDDEIPQQIHEVELTTAVCELELFPLIEESDFLIREIFPEKEKSTGTSKESGKSLMDHGMITKVKPRAALGHSRIPSLSNQYVARPLTRNGSALTNRSAPASAIPLRSTKKSNSSNLYTQLPPSKPITNRLTSSDQKSRLADRFVSDDTVSELLGDHFEVEDVLFEL